MGFHSPLIRPAISGGGLALGGSHESMSEIICNPTFSRSDPFDSVWFRLQLFQEGHLSKEKRAPGWLFDIGDEILPNYMGIIS